MSLMPPVGSDLLNQTVKHLPKVCLSAGKLPPLKTANLDKASAVIIRAVAGGRLTQAEGEALSRMLETHRKTTEMVEIEERLAKLERATEVKS